ncbi:MAG: sulfotransferase [Cyanobacteria bacterium J06597_1]
MASTTHPVSTAERPVILVGMPRSGSTILSRLLNESPELFIVNDFYLLQRAEGLGVLKSDLDASEAKCFAANVIRRIKCRIEREDSTDIEDALCITPSQEAELEEYALSVATEESRSWHEILSSIMHKAGEMMGKPHWGYNTPQDYLHIDTLFDVYPDARIVFLLRDPRGMLKSYKNVVNNGYHAINRYHPVIQTLAWRTAARVYFQAKQKGQSVLLVRYEDVIEKTNSTLQSIAEFCDIDIPELDLADFGNNSSYSMGPSKKKSLCESEKWLCEAMARTEMLKLDYELSDSQFKLNDTGYLLSISVKVLQFYVSKAFSSRDVRKRIQNIFLRSFIKPA